jgi:Putative prokaryotic signal transducing protein
VKRVLTARHVFEAHHFCNVLAAAGIGAHVRNTFISGALGELPADNCAPEVWVNDSRDAQRAELLITEIQSAVRDAPWTCASCRETIEGQFFSCWKCSANRPD